MLKAGRGSFFESHSEDGVSSACLQKAGSVETLSVPDCGRAAPSLTVLGGLSEALAVPLRLYDNDRPAITATFKRRQRF